MSAAIELPEFAWWIGHGRTDFLGMRGPFSPAHADLYLRLGCPDLNYVAAEGEELASLFEIRSDG